MNLGKKSCLAIGSGTFVLGYLGMNPWVCGAVMIPCITALTFLGDSVEKKPSNAYTRLNRNRTRKPSLLASLRNFV